MSDNYQSLLDCYFDRYTPNGKLAEDSDEDSGIVQNNHDDRYSTTERIHGPSAVKFDTSSKKHDGRPRLHSVINSFHESKIFASTPNLAGHVTTLDSYPRQNLNIFKNLQETDREYISHSDESTILDVLDLPKVLTDLHGNHNKQSHSDDTVDDSDPRQGIPNLPMFFNNEQELRYKYLKKRLTFNSYRQFLTTRDHVLKNEKRWSKSTDPISVLCSPNSTDKLLEPMNRKLPTYQESCRIQNQFTSGEHLDEIEQFQNSRSLFSSSSTSSVRHESVTSSEPSVSQITTKASKTQSIDNIFSFESSTQSEKRHNNFKQSARSESVRIYSAKENFKNSTKADAVPRQSHSQSDRSEQEDSGEYESIQIVMKPVIRKEVPKHTFRKVDIKPNTQIKRELGKGTNLCRRVSISTPNISGISEQFIHSSDTDQWISVKTPPHSVKFERPHLDKNFICQEYSNLIKCKEMSGSRTTLKNPFKALKKAVSMGQGLNQAGVNDKGQIQGQREDEGQKKKDKKGKGLTFKSIKNLFRKKPKKVVEKEEIKEVGDTQLTPTTSERAKPKRMSTCRSLEYLFEEEEPKFHTGKLINLNTDGTKKIDFRKLSDQPIGIFIPNDKGHHKSRNKRFSLEIICE